MEEWLNISGYEGLYQISSLGNVRSKRFPKRNLKPLGNTQRYLKVRLYRDGEWTSFPVHRLVLITFIPNPESKPQGNHINGNKKDNKAVNLEWVTASENCKHRVHTLGIIPKGHKKVPYTAVRDGEEYYFNSVKEIKAAGFTLTAVYRSMRAGTGRCTHKGFTWKKS